MSLRGKRILEWCLFSFIGIILIASGALLFYQKSYAGKMYPNVKIAGIDVSGQTKKQAESLVKKDLDNFSKKTLTLSNNDKVVAFKFLETGLTFDTNTAIDKAYSIGRSNQFFPQLWLSVKAALADSTVTVPFRINRQAYDAFVASKAPELNISAQNAAITIENGVVKLTPEVSGQTIDSKDLANQILLLAGNRDASPTIKVRTAQSTPEVTSAMLTDAKAQAESYLSKKIVLTYAAKTFSPSASEIGKWIVFNPGNGAYAASLDANNIKTYLNVIARSIDIQRKDTKINAVDNSVIDQGAAGLYVNKDAAVTAITNQIGTASSVTVALVTTNEDPKIVKIFPSEGIVPGRFPGRYIDIDLPKQLMTLFDGTTQVAQYIVSSGKASTPTPLGTRTIQSKNPKAWSAQFGLWMPFWQSLGEGYGIHELPEWPGGYKEGADHLGTPVSHGCIRLGVGPAEMVYNWAPIGTSVFIHK